MQGGNGHKPLYRIRGVIPSKRVPLLRGPFTGAMVIQVLEARGWVPESTRSDEWTVWRHVDHDRMVLVNPYWDQIWENDRVFCSLCRQIGLPEEELVTLLEALL